MLVLKKDLWEKDKILTVLSTDNWGEQDATIISDCVLAELKQLLLECIDQDDKCILLLDVNKGEVPPMTYIIKCMSFLLGIKSIIQDAVYFSVIYDKNESGSQLVETILKIYQPARPLLTVNSKDQIIKLCQDKELVDFSYKI